MCKDSLFSGSPVFGHLDRFQYFAVTDYPLANNLCICIFTLFEVHLLYKFLEVELLGQGEIQMMEQMLHCDRQKTC